MKALNVRVIDTDFYQVNIKKAILISPTYMKVKMSSSRLSGERVYGLDFGHALPDIAYNASPNEALTAVIGSVENRGETLHTLHGWDCGYTKHVTQFPHFFCVADGETETDMPVDVEYYAPAVETGKEFQERLLPYLHEAAKAFIDQVHDAMPHLTGNSRNILQYVRDTKSNARFESSVNRYRLPIGYVARELKRHADGGATLKRPATEALVKDIHEVFTKADSWWEHHYGHDVRYWNKHHDARRILLDKPDGTVAAIYDIDAEHRKNMPLGDKADVKVQAEREFHELATKWFSAALYGQRDHVTERELRFQEKT